MEADFPQSAREAEEHIRQIRHDKGLGDGPERIGNNAADLESALALLSDDLYQTTTHFLLELIQNADDNFYETDCPTLSICWSPGWVRIDCNERGFARKNIEAICRICQSTKSGRSKSAGFVGEKGIGFKAVFKVASTVWISSGHYSFRFDRDAHLGMIAPIWDQFPEQRKDGYTSILLKLAKDCDETRIVNELKSYDEKMLLFLRRLRRLEIDIKPTILSFVMPFAKPFKTVLSSHGHKSENPSMIVLTNNGVEKHYFVWRHSIGGLPSEARRPGISTSEVVLAFPNTGINGDLPVNPVIESQNVYAFLPIRDGGLPFLLQADFLLPASSEDVHIDSPWNKALAAAAAIAYVDAARHMANGDNSLRYSWVRYIPTAPAKTTFFENVRQDILNRLRKSKIIISQSGRKKTGASLTMVPSHLRDSSGRPFIARRRNRNSFLSAQYNKTLDWPYLNVLGVKHMDNHVFFSEMAKVLNGNPSSFFRNKTKEWHASFARAMFALNQSYGLSSLPIIPLQSGKWISINKSSAIYFSSSKSTLAIPEGIELNIVDPDAEANPDRKKLFVHLGVQDLEPSHVSDAIIDSHQSKKFKPGKLQPEVLVSHAEFLFRHSKTVSRTSLIWMAAELGPCRKSDSMYLLSNAPGAASTVLPKVAHSQYGFLHPAYLRVGGSNKKLWFDYLIEYHLVDLYPRLLNRTSAYMPAEHVHEDFNLLVGKSSQQWLFVLRDGWELYKTWLDPKSATSHANLVLTYLRERNVRCTGSVRSEQVQNTYMPLDQLTKEYGKVAPFLDIPDPRDRRWLPVLKCLLVGTETDLTFYLKCLSGAKKTSRITSGKIREIMHEIEDCVESVDKNLNSFKQGQVRHAIQNEALIYVPPKKDDETKRGFWVSQSDCFWRGESWITQSVGLERIYPDLDTLFRTHLLVPNVGPDHLIREAAALSGQTQTPPNYVEKLFLALTSHVKAQGLDFNQKAKIQDLDMFPVASPTENGPVDYLTSISNVKPWLIADRAHFRTQFQPFMPLLAFNADFILKIKPLLIALDLDKRFLSKLATSITEAHGDVKLHKKLTQSYRTRSKHLFRLIPENQADEKQLRDKFRGVEVFFASKIVQYWRAPLGIRLVQSTQSEGVAFLECDYAGDLRIYVHDNYEDEAYPSELVEQLQYYFNVPIENRDLLTVALMAPDERVEHLFEVRGIAPLLENDIMEEENEGDEFSYAPVTITGKTSRSGRESRFSRLFSHTRFAPSFSRQANYSATSLPSYGVAVARATSNAIGRPVERRTFGNAITLSALKGPLKELDFVQTHDAVTGTRKGPSTFWGRIWGLVQRDADIGEAIVSDILAAVLGAQYDQARMWTPRDKRKNHQPTFSFTDKQGRFSAFLMRLDGMSGKAQGYTRLIYHLDVKTTDTDTFKITQFELDRAREYSVHSQPDPSQQAPSKHVSVLVHISDFRSEPKIRFLADPWDLFDDGQLVLENTSTYQARLNLRLRQVTRSAGGTAKDTGFDSIQIVPNGDGDEDDVVPEYETGDTLKKGPEMRELGHGNEGSSGAKV